VTEIYVGVCAFKKKYYKSEINCVEVQQTFYNIPMEKTVRKWRNEAPESFIFNLKVFQGLTHNPRLPTWKRYTRKLTETQKKQAGDLKLNDLTKKWIDTYINYMKILDGKVLVVQTPASFKPTNENVSNAMKFFEYFFERLKNLGAKFWIGWEPRGDWLKNIDALDDIFSSFNKLIHIVDIFFHEPVSISETSYFRLHGKPYLNYRYRYTDKDFDLISQKIERLKGVSSSIFIMLNNVYMEDDALRLKKFLGVK